MLVRTLIGVLLFTSCSCLTVLAADAPPAIGWELSLRAGPGGMQDSLTGFPNQDRPPYKFEYSTGIASGVALGYRFHPRWRAELELARRDNDLGASSPAGSSVSGHQDVMAVMGNVYCDFMTGYLTPYLGVGAGYSWIDVDNFRVNNQLHINDTATAAAFQGIAGALYRINTRWSASLDYRYFRTTDPKVTNSVGEIMGTSIRNHAFMFGLTRNF